MTPMRFKYNHVSRGTLSLIGHRLQLITEVS